MAREKVELKEVPGRQGPEAVEVAVKEENEQHSWHTKLFINGK